MVPPSPAPTSAPDPPAVVSYSSASTKGQSRSLIDAPKERRRFHLLRLAGAGDQWLLAELRAIAAAVRRGHDGAGMRRFIDFLSGSGTWNSLPQDKRSGLARLAVTVAENLT